MRPRLVLSAAVAGTTGPQALLLAPLLATSPGPGRRRLLSTVVMPADASHESADGRRE